MQTQEEKAKISPGEGGYPRAPGEAWRVSAFLTAHIGRPTRNTHALQIASWHPLHSGVSCISRQRSLTWPTYF